MFAEKIEPDDEYMYQYAEDEEKDGHATPSRKLNQNGMEHFKYRRNPRTYNRQRPGRDMFGSDRRPGSGRPGRDMFGSDRKPRFDQPRRDMFGSDRRPRFDRPRRDMFGSDRRPGFDRPGRDMFGSDRRPGSDRPGRDMFGSDRKPGSDRPARDMFGFDRRSGFDRGHNRPVHNNRRPQHLQRRRIASRPMDAAWREVSQFFLRIVY